mgnify:CR=1 FL=1
MPFIMIAARGLMLLCAVLFLTSCASPSPRDLVVVQQPKLITIPERVWVDVGELAEPYDVTLQAISKHLRVLEDAGLVTKTRDAQRRTVHLEHAPLNLMTTWIERYRRQAESRYRRLDSLLAEMNAKAPKRAIRKGRLS